MKKFLIVVFILIGHISLSQENKNLNDSVFYVGDIINTPNITYSLNSGYEVDPVFADSVQLIALFLLKNPKIKVEIRSHTESRGSRKANIELSENRAELIKKHLVLLWIDEGRLEIKGMGKEELIYSDEQIALEKNVELKEKMHQQNRRTELVIINN